MIIKKHILVLGIGPTQGLEHNLTAEKMYSVSFTVTKNKCCLSLHYSGGIAVYLLMVKKFTNSKQEIPKLWQQLCLGNISKEWSANNMKKKKKWI